MADHTAASVAVTDVQAALDLCSDGDTVVIPAGSSTWNNRITTSKQVQFVGAGSGRIIAYDNGTDLLTIATGSVSVNISGYSPGFSIASISIGQTLRLIRNNSLNNWMQGLVTGISGQMVTINITTTNGSSTNQKRWLIATSSSTIITCGFSGKAFNLTESTVGNISISGIKFVDSSNRTLSYIFLNYVLGGKPILIHDCWFECIHNFVFVDSTTNRGVIWNNSFQGSSNNSGLLITDASIRIKDASGTTIAPSSWTSVAKWGTADTNGDTAMYIETNDFHCMYAAADMDDGGRMVWRYNLMDHANFTVHGSDTSWYGGRYFEYYNNTTHYNGYSDGSSFNPSSGWLFIRGGSFAIHDNTFAAFSGNDYHPSTMALSMLNLRRNAGAAPCWGTGFSGGAKYPGPRQVGMGRVTGTGVDGLGRSTDSYTYVGDTEPGYIWSNNITPTISLVDDPIHSPPSGCTSPDTVVNYVVINRDFFNGTAKPSYATYQYPHPLISGGTGKIIVLTGNMTFGSVIVGNTLNSTLTITNNGDTTLTVTSITYPTGYSGAFSGTVSANGGVQNVTVTFAPTLQQAYNGTITVNSDATSGTNTIAVSGTGSAPISQGSPHPERPKSVARRVVGGGRRV